MPRTKSRAGPGQDFQRSGANPTIFCFFRPGLGQVVSGPEQVSKNFFACFDQLTISHVMMTVNKCPEYSCHMESFLLHSYKPFSAFPKFHI